MMFVSIIDLNTENDSDSTFLILIIDPMQQPEKTLKYDKNTKFDMQKWIQVRNSKQGRDRQKASRGLFSTISSLNSFKLSRTEAVFEYTSTNGNQAFQVDYECRKVELYGRGELSSNTSVLLKAWILK